MKAAAFVTLSSLLVFAYCVACADEVLPKELPAGTVRYLIGGDARDDTVGVVPWAFDQAKERGASAFIFLGDMELTPALDKRFKEQLAQLQPIPFFPVLGNHEVEAFGFLPVRCIERLFGKDPEKRFRDEFLGTQETAVNSVFSNRVVYSVDLPGDGVHFIALDNVSQKGFGKAQMDWLTSDLQAAKAAPRTKYIIVGMHKALAGSGVTKHAMDEDGDAAIKESNAALTLFQTYGVVMIFASHKHEFAQFRQGGVPSYITGGMGAPLGRGDPEHAFHHVLQLDVTAAGLNVTVIRFNNPPRSDPDTEDDE